MLAADKVTIAATLKAIKGEGTVGQIPKFSASDEINDSVITQSGSNIGVGTTAPIANLHVEGAQPPALGGDGADAAKALQISGGTGGDTTGTSGQSAGKGANVMIQAGAGGNAPPGSNNGAGGNVYIQPGAAGAGAGSVGLSGKWW